MTGSVFSFVSVVLFGILEAPILVLSYPVVTNKSICSTRKDCAVVNEGWCMGFVQFDGIKGAVQSECKQVSTGSPCMCMKPPPACNSSLTCSQGYRCVHSPFLDNRPVCIHCTFVDLISKATTFGSSPLPKFPKLDDGPRCTPSATPRPTPSVSPVITETELGYTWAECISDHDCAVGRKCIRSRFSDKQKPCRAKKSRWCVCRPSDSFYNCSQSSDCLRGDRCVTYVIDSLPERRNFCVACEYVKKGVDVVPVDGLENCEFSATETTSIVRTLQALKPVSLAKHYDVLSQILASRSSPRPAAGGIFPHD